MKLKIHCVCRQIDDGRKMIQCDGCKVWYHTECVQISEEMLATTDVWFCKRECKEKISDKCDLYTEERVMAEIQKLKVYIAMSIIITSLYIIFQSSQ